MTRNMLKKAVENNSGMVSSSGVAVPLLGVMITGRLQGRAVEMEVAQRYRNTGEAPLEAVYLFPLPEGAAVCGLEVRTGDRVFRGEVEEREKAFERYDEAMAEGHGAVLLDQERPNVYQMSVGNLLPGQEAVASVRLAFRADQAGDAVRLMVPSTVAPRYSPASLTDGQRREIERTAPPYALTVPYGMSVAIDVEAASPIRLVGSPSHPVRCEVEGRRAKVTFSRGEEAMDRDFVLTVEAAEPHRASALVARFEGRDHLLLELFPGDREAKVNKPRNVCFLLDCSGSMDGDSIDQARRAVALCLRALREGDRFQVVLFGSGFRFLFRSPRKLSQRSLDEAAARIAEVDADMGGTEILRPLEALAEKYAGDAVDLVVLTDGEVSNEEQVLAFAGARRGLLRIFSFGIGAGSSEFLVRGLARETGGAAEFIHPGERIEEKVLRQFGRIDAPLLDEVKVRWGAAKMEQAPAATPPLFPGDALVLAARGPEGKEIPEGAVVRLTARSAEGKVDFEAPVTRLAEGGAVPLFWARERIRDLEAAFGLPLGSRRQRGTDRKRETLIALSKLYGLISSETSLVAVEERADGEKAVGPAVLMKVPVAVPAGWHGIGSALTMALQAAPSVMGVQSPPPGRRMYRKLSEFPSGDEFDGVMEDSAFEQDLPLANIFELAPPPGLEVPWHLRLLGEQRADGSFDLSDLVRLESGLDEDALEALVSSVGRGKAAERVVATALAVVLLRQRAAESGDTWRAAVEKALEWLKGRRGPDTDGLLVEVVALAAAPGR